MADAYLSLANSGRSGRRLSRVYQGSFMSEQEEIPDATCLAIVSRASNARRLPLLPPDGLCTVRVRSRFRFTPRNVKRRST